MQRTPRRLCVALGLAALTWPTTGANAAPAARPKKVYAHYMTCFTLDVGFCKEEIRLAQPHGLDGFAMDFGEWLEPNPPHNPTRYVANMDNVFETARQLGTRFKLLLTPEYCVQPVGVQVEDFAKGRGVTPSRNTRCRICSHQRMSVYTPSLQDQAAAGSSSPQRLRPASQSSLPGCLTFTPRPSPPHFPTAICTSRMARQLPSGYTAASAPGGKATRRTPREGSCQRFTERSDATGPDAPKRGRGPFLRAGASPNSAPNGA